MPAQNVNHRVYPEVYYKVQPYILMACDEIDIYDDFEMPSQDMVNQMTDQVYSNVCQMYPEYVEAHSFREVSPEAAAAYKIYGNVEYQQYGGNLFVDLIQIMLLNELFGRRRRRRRYW